MKEHSWPRGNGASDVHVSHQFEFLLTLIDGHATIAGDVLELASSTWAIHGSIPVDGEVILAEFETSAQARAVLATLSSIPETQPTVARRVITGRRAATRNGRQATRTISRS